MIDNEKVIKELLNIFDTLRTYKSKNTIYLSDGSSFDIPNPTKIVLNSNSKSYR